VGLVLSTTYLGATLLIQSQVAGVARASLATAGIDASRTLVAPLPMSLLWRVVALDGDRYHVGWRSVLDDEPTVSFTAYERGARPPGGTDAWPTLARLDWFTDGFVRLREREGTLIATDLRLGTESGYVFAFVVDEHALDEEEGREMNGGER